MTRFARDESDVQGTRSIDCYLRELNAAGEEMQHHHRLGADQCLNAGTVVHES